jgi:precorrin-4/cobalt-precorrin-4 C11-methyltransferase
MIHFVGAGPGAPDLITVRGMTLLRSAGMVVYTGSLIAPELLAHAPSGCELHNSAPMTLDEVIGAMKDGFARGLSVVRLHTGDPSLYGAIREQMDRLKELGVPFETVPGVSSLGAAAAALNAEYTLPGVSQTLIVTRMEGRTPVPERVRALASHGASMAFFLSAGMLDELCRELIGGGYEPDTPAALVYKASWPEQRILRAALSDLPTRAEAAAMPRKTALVLVGRFLGDDYEVSRLYDASFEHEFRRARPADSHGLPEVQE